MKQLSIFLLLSIFLASCGTPAAAPQLIVTFTPTLIPKTATSQPTNTAEPTATKDPMAGAPPGATEFENGNFYKPATVGGTPSGALIKDLQGNPVRAEWNAELHMWLVSMITSDSDMYKDGLNDGIALIDAPIDF